VSRALLVLGTAVWVELLFMSAASSLRRRRSSATQQGGRPRAERQEQPGRLKHLPLPAGRRGRRENERR
jgi:hypothetical protein